MHPNKYFKQNSIMSQKKKKKQIMFYNRCAHFCVCGSVQSAYVNQADKSSTPWRQVWESRWYLGIVRPVSCVSLGKKVRLEGGLGGLGKGLKCQVKEADFLCRDLDQLPNGSTLGCSWEQRG